LHISIELNTFFVIFFFFCRKNSHNFRIFGVPNASLIGGKLAGITGMILAIPTYTL
jgi:hypothetical protein